MTSKIILILALLAGGMTAVHANAPGGAYIQCNAGSASPIRCTPDGW